MASLQKGTERLAAQAEAQRNPHYHTKVVSIVFNAWHYIDSNLWASLVSHIIEKLASAVDKTAAPDAKRAGLTSQIMSTKAIIAVAEADKKQVRQQIVTTTAKLEDLKTQRQKAESRLREIQLSDLVGALSENEDVRKILGRVADETKIGYFAESTKALQLAFDEAANLKAQVLETAKSLAIARNAWFLPAAVAFILAVPPGLGWLVGKFGYVLPSIGELAAQIVLGLGAVVHMKPCWR